jgi:hypothetical protein
MTLFPKQGRKSCNLSSSFITRKDSGPDFLLRKYYRIRKWKFFSLFFPDLHILQPDELETHERKHPGSSPQPNVPLWKLWT